jgi:hypothetical protein
MYIDDDMLEQLTDDSPRGKKPHLEHQDKLYNGLLAIEAVIGSVEMYAGHDTTFRAHLHAVKEMLEARIDNE